MTYKKFLLLFVVLLVAYFASVAVKIYTYPLTVDERSTSVETAIVLGAAVWNNQPSPVFTERIRHAVVLYKTGLVKSIIFTGGIGERDSRAESEVARQYAITQGVAESDIFAETNSRTTYGNLTHAKQIMDANNVQTAFIVSDPLHMKRSITIARGIGIEAFPSPTHTSLYQSLSSRLKLLLWEMFFYPIDRLHLICRTASSSACDW